ncbi:MAG: hypothetical protein IPK33_10945 [Gemmatimonadetes bacterium]|nr:hypothetical protein [Gemmatimonadota bacterium]
MLANRIRHGISIGLIGAAATAGALIGLGLRHGAATLPFEMGGALFSGPGASPLRSRVSPSRSASCRTCCG